jgi:hypothetical protein
MAWLDLRGFGLMWVAIGMLSLAACGTSGDSVPVPDDWRTYSEGGSHFTISSPGAWTIVWNDPYVVEDLYESVDGSDEEDASQVARPLAFGGFEAVGSYSPEVQVRVSIIPDEGPGLDSLLADVEELSEIPEIDVAAIDKVVVNGVESLQILVSRDLSPQFEGRWWMKQLSQLDGSILWTVTCGVDSPSGSEPVDDIDICDSVIQTFKVLTP